MSSWDSDKSAGDLIKSADWDAMVADQKGHATRHENGGSDEVNDIDIANSGTLLSSHSVRHEEGGADELTLENLDLKRSGNTIAVQADVGNDLILQNTGDGKTITTIDQDTGAYFAQQRCGIGAKDIIHPQYIRNMSITSSPISTQYERWRKPMSGTLMVTIGGTVNGVRRMYILDDYNEMIYAFRINRVQLWSIDPIGQYGRTPSGLSVDTSTETIYIGLVTSGDYYPRLLALNSDGSEKWIWTDTTQEPTSELAGKAVINGGDIFCSYSSASVGEGDFYAISPSGSMNWEKHGFNPGPVALSNNESYVYFTSGNTVYKYAVSDGTQQWSYPTGGTIQHMVVAPSDGDVFLAYDAGIESVSSGGSSNWNYTIPSTKITGIALSNDGTTIYGQELGEGSTVMLHAVNETDGSQAWTYIQDTTSGNHASVHSIPFVLKNDYIATQYWVYNSADTQLAVVDSSGTEQWTYTEHAPASPSGVNGIDNTIYWGCDAFHAFGYQTGDMYLDDGTNTSSGNAGLRLFDGSTWVDL